MDLDDPRVFSLFLEIYGTLPRAGPGSTEDTLRALALVPSDPHPKTVLDLGCGPGAKTLVLAEALPGASIVAMDLVPQMVSEARRRLSESGFGDRVQTTRVADYRAQHKNETTALEIADEAAKEIEVFRRYHEYYTYGFFVVKPTAETLTENIGGE